MIDKSWMLNPQAIRHAKTCIQIIKDRTQQKLKLSQADFFQQLDDCAKKIRSVEFIAAHHQLMAMAEHNTFSDRSNTGTVIPLFGRKAKSTAMPLARAVDSVETVAFAGKHYPKWQAGKSFQGLYRGQPHYQ